VERFKRDRTTLDDQVWSGRPLTLQTDNHRAEVNALIKGNRRITIREIALPVGISYGSTFAIDYDDLGYSKVCARWVPRQWMDEHKQTRLQKSERFLQTQRRRIGPIATNCHRWRNMGPSLQTML
jgi:hypothetical protein